MAAMPMYMYGKIHQNQDSFDSESLHIANLWEVLRFYSLGFAPLTKMEPCPSVVK